jgi:hypothetical protein
MTIKNTITAIVLGSALVAGGGCNYNVPNSGVPPGEYEINIRNKPATLKIYNDGSGRCKRLEECEQTCSLYFNISTDDQTIVVDYKCDGNVEKVLNQGKELTEEELQETDKQKSLNEIMKIAQDQVRKEYKKKGKDEIDRVLDKI